MLVVVAATAITVAGFLTGFGLRWYYRYGKASQARDASLSFSYSETQALRVARQRQMERRLRPPQLEVGVERPVHSMPEQTDARALAA
jgi:hypothetical protein